MMADGRSVWMDIPLSRRLKLPLYSHDSMEFSLQRRLGGQEPVGQLSRWKEFHSRSYETSSKVTTSRTQAFKSNSNQEFHVKLDVRNFRPDELSIKMVNNRVVIEGKHVEKQNGHDSIQRQFRQTYDLPSGIDTDKFKSSLSDDGILEIHAPKMVVQKPADKIIPIVRMGVKKQPDLSVRPAKGLNFKVSDRSDF